MPVTIITQEDLERTVAPLVAELKALRAALDRAQIAPRKEWLTVDEYAETVGKSVRTVRRWIDTGQLETKRSGNVLLVRI